MSSVHKCGNVDHF